MNTKNKILTVSGIIALIILITALLIYINLKNRIPDSGVLVFEEITIHE